MLNKKFINNFSIEIGQDRFRLYDPMITFCINDHFCTTKLEYIKDWINDIWNSKGNGNKKSYEAKKNLDEFFHSLISPFIDYSYLNKENK